MSLDLIRVLVSIVNSFLADSRNSKGMLRNQLTEPGLDMLGRIRSQPSYTEVFVS